MPASRPVQGDSPAPERSRLFIYLGFALLAAIVLSLQKATGTLKLDGLGIHGHWEGPAALFMLVIIATIMLIRVDRVKK